MRELIKVRPFMRMDYAGELKLSGGELVFL